MHLPVEMGVKDMEYGDVVDVSFRERVVKKHGTDTNRVEVSP